MPETVYLLGAGFNLAVTHNTEESRWPPTSANLMKLVVSSDHFIRHRRAIAGSVSLTELFDRIRHYWHIEEEGLKHLDFDIEEALTLFDLQAAHAGNGDEMLDVLRSSIALRTLLTDYLADVSIACSGLPRGYRFGLRVLEEGADVLTFNYDSIAEDAIALASGLSGSTSHSPLPSPLQRLDSESPLSRLQTLFSLPWKIWLASGFQFSGLSVPTGMGLGNSDPDFYSKPGNELYESKRVLKLHGSINWWTPQAARANALGSQAKNECPGLRAPVSSQIKWLNGSHPTSGAWFEDPVIVPPVLSKQFNDLPFPLVWAQARASLESCRRLVIVGYSFPPTDFNTKKLFLDAFAGETKLLEDVIIVNPSSDSIQVVQRLTNIDSKAIRRLDFDEYLDMPSSLG